MSWCTRVGGLEVALLIGDRCYKAKLEGEREIAEGGVQKKQLGGKEGEKDNYVQLIIVYSLKYGQISWMLCVKFFSFLFVLYGD